MLSVLKHRSSLEDKRRRRVGTPSEEERRDSGDGGLHNFDVKSEPKSCSPPLLSPFLTSPPNSSSGCDSSDLLKDEKIDRDDKAAMRGLVASGGGGDLDDDELGVIGVDVIIKHERNCESEEDVPRLEDEAEGVDMQQRDEDANAAAAAHGLPHFLADTVGGVSGGEEQFNDINSDCGGGDPRDEVEGDGSGGEKKRRKPVNLCIECPVCGGPAPDHLHFGGQCCYACRAFFRRTSQRPISSFRCRGGKGDCVVTSEGKSCIPCRLTKCLKVGMDPSLIRGKKGSEKSGVGDQERSPPAAATHPSQPPHYGYPAAGRPPPSLHPHLVFAGGNQHRRPGGAVVGPISRGSGGGDMEEGVAWLKKRADILIYEGMKLQFQANLLNGRADIMSRVDSMARNGGIISKLPAAAGGVESVIGPRPITRMTNPNTTGLIFGDGGRSKHVVHGTETGRNDDQLGQTTAAAARRNSSVISKGSVLVSSLVEKSYASSSYSTSPSPTLYSSPSSLNLSTTSLYSSPSSFASSPSGYITSCSASPRYSRQQHRSHPYKRPSAGEHFRNSLSSSAGLEKKWPPASLAVVRQTGSPPPLTNRQQQRQYLPPSSPARPIYNSCISSPVFPTSANRGRPTILNESPPLPALDILEHEGFSIGKGQSLPSTTSSVSPPLLAMPPLLPTSSLPAESNSASPPPAAFEPLLSEKPELLTRPPPTAAPLDLSLKHTAAAVEREDTAAAAFRHSQIRGLPRIFFRHRPVSLELPTA